MLFFLGIKPGITLVLVVKPGHFFDSGQTVFFEEVFSRTVNIIMTTLSSIGTPGIPGGSYVVMTMVLTSVGIPAQGLALILSIDRPLNMLRTSVNVTGALVVALMIDE